MGREKIRNFNAEGAESTEDTEKNVGTFNGECVGEIPRFARNDGAGDGEKEPV